jgi:hypothetical protein
MAGGREDRCREPDYPNPKQVGTNRVHYRPTTVFSHKQPQRGPILKGTDRLTMAKTRADRDDRSHGSTGLFLRDVYSTYLDPT